MNLRRNAGILATGSIALALIGAGVGASFTDHWSATQKGTVAFAPPPAAQLTITSNSDGAVIDATAKTVTFADFVITTPASDPMGNAGYDQFGITSTGSGVFQITATVTGDMPAAELAKFSLADGPMPLMVGDPLPNIFPLSATPVVIATQTGPGSMYLGLTPQWAGLTAAAEGHSLTITYSIDAS